MYILSYGSSYDFIILWLSDSYVDIIYIYYHIIMNFAGKTYLDVWEVRRCSDGSGSEKLEIGFVDAQVCRVMTRFFFFKLGLETVQLRKMCLFKDLFLIFFWLSHFFLDVTDLLNSLNSIEEANFVDFKWFNQPILGDWMIWFIIKPVIFIKK